MLWFCVTHYLALYYYLGNYSEGSWLVEHKLIIHLTKAGLRKKKKKGISCHIGSSVNHWATFLPFLLSLPSLCTPYSPWSVKKMPKRVLSVLVYTLGRVVQPLVPVMTVKNSLLGIFALKLPAILSPFLIEITSSVCQGHRHAGFVFCCFPCSCEARSQCIGNDCL